MSVTNVLTMTEETENYDDVIEIYHALQDYTCEQGSCLLDDCHINDFLQFYAKHFGHTISAIGGGANGDVNNNTIEGTVNDNQEAEEEWQSA